MNNFVWAGIAWDVHVGPGDDDDDLIGVEVSNFLAEIESFPLVLFAANQNRVVRTGLASSQCVGMIRRGKHRISTALQNFSTELAHEWVAPNHKKSLRLQVQSQRFTPELLLTRMITRDFSAHAEPDWHPIVVRSTLDLKNRRQIRFELAFPGTELCRIGSDP